MSQLRKRSEVLAGTRVPEEKPPSRPGPPCPVEGCGSRTFVNDSGVTCGNGHGGILEREEFDDWINGGAVYEAGDVARRWNDEKKTWEIPLAAIVGPQGPATEAKEAVLQRLTGPADPAMTTSRPLFASANKGPGINPDMERIVETIYAIDASRDYAELEAHLEVGDQRSDYGTLQRHLDKAETRARRAHALYLGMKLERTKWELDADDVKAKLREKALAALEDDKDKGDRTKRITNDDVDAKMREMFGDEIRSQTIKRAKLKGSEEHLERLAELWKTKCYSLSTMLTNLRK